MKRTPTLINRLIIALALTTQLFIVAPTIQAAAQNDNSANVNQSHDMSTHRQSRRRNRCRERCLRQYRLCLRGIVNPNQARCRERYRRCLRTCRR
jgi:flagellar biosynthesis protein FliP